jgi:hypothetical protein
MQSQSAQSLFFAGQAIQNDNRKASLLLLLLSKGLLFATKE